MRGESIWAEDLPVEAEYAWRDRRYCGRGTRRVKGSAQPSCVAFSLPHHGAESSAVEGGCRQPTRQTEEAGSPPSHTRNVRLQYLVSSPKALHHGTTGAGQIAKIQVRCIQDRESARIVPFLRSPTRTVERASSPHGARTGDAEVPHERRDFCPPGCVARVSRCGDSARDRLPDCA